MKIKKFIFNVFKSIRKRWWIWLIVILVLWGIFGRGDNFAQVELDTVTQKTITKTMTASGQLAVLDSHKVYAPLTAQIDQVFVDEGEEVQQGEVLFTYKEESLKSALEAAELALLQAKQAKETVEESVLNELDIKSYQAAVDQTRAARDAARFNYEQDNNETNKVAWNAAITAHEQALAAYHAALEANPGSLDLDSAQKAIESAEAAVEVAQKNYEEKSVTAPVAGVASLSRDTYSKVIAVPEKVTTQGQQVATIISPTQLRFNAEVDETDVPLLNVGQAVDLELDAYPGEAFAGEIEKIAGTTSLNSSGSEVYIVTVKIDNPMNTFRADLSGQATFNLETVKDVTAISSRALVIDDEDDIVYVYNEETSTVNKQVVELGLESSTDAQIVSGITVGQKVVVSNNVRDLNDGDLVEVVDAVGGKVGVRGNTPLRQTETTTNE